MAQNLTQTSLNTDEMELREIVKILLNYKKLIISTILIFTTASIIYSLSLDSLFKSSAKLEIGYFEMPDGNRNLIEEPSDLISDLNILLLINPKNKLSQKVSIDLIENKVIFMETTSSSVEQNENILNELISYIDGRHSRLQKLRAENNKKVISFDLETTKAEINHIKLKLSNNNQSQYFDIISNLEKQDDAIEILKLFDNSYLYEDKLFYLNKKLEILIRDLENADSEVIIKSQIIGNIETDEIKPKFLLMISVSIFIGFFTSILFALINNFIKNFRESET